MRIIGVTGGIASGKGLVEQCFINRGIPVIDADAVSREVMLPGKAAYKTVHTEFGSGFFNSDGTLNRAKLRAHVFADKSALERLNALTHPIIKDAIVSKLEQMKACPLAVLIAPLLFETGLNTLCGSVWLVICDTDIRVKRLMLRDGVTKEEAMAIISTQLSDCEKAGKSDIIIDNSGEKTRTLEIIENLICEVI